MAHGSIAAYIRVSAGFECLAIAALEEAGFWACHDDGDPDRPTDSCDIYVTRDYGMTNPDARIVEHHHASIGALLQAGGIEYEDRGGAVLRGTPLPREEIVPVLDARTMEPTGFTLHARNEWEAAERVAVMAETLGMNVEDLLLWPSTAWANRFRQEPRPVAYQSLPQPRCEVGHGRHRVHGQLAS